MSYIPVAVSYRRRATTPASSVPAGRITSASGKRQRFADAVLERRRLPAELLLRARRVGGGVPQQELELAARDEGSDARTGGERVAEGSHRARERHWEHPPHAAAVR